MLYGFTLYTCYLSHYLKDNLLSIDEFANKCEISSAHLCNLMAGITTPTFCQAYKIAQELGVFIEDVFSLE